ncbi:MAG: S-layer homology domain-containing protein [Acidimicrobiia bacterium]|nr:S-layer homology domain-containing protein [Acidimicrobiia bacterium]
MSHRPPAIHPSPPGTRGRHRRSVVGILVGVGLLVASVAAMPPAAAAPDSAGTDYWLAFQENNCCGSPTLTLFISGATATTGTVSVPGLSFSQDFTVTPGEVTSVVLPAGANATTADGVQDRGVRVTAADEVTVYGLNRVQASTDAFLAYPTDILGTQHTILAWNNNGVVNRTQFAVAATADDTTVTVVPSVTTGARVAGEAYDITLDEGQVYQLANVQSSTADLTGSTVTSDKPVAVFGGHGCANIPTGATTACDHIVQQLPPIDTWGRSFVTMPLATRIGGDTFRILSASDGTTVSINGAVVATLDAGEFHQQLIDGPSTITTSNPTLVAQYSNGTSFDNVTSDPFMMLIPPFEQFLNSYTVTTPASGFTFNFINVVAPNAAVGEVLLDGAPIPAEDYTPIGASGFSGAQVPVQLGAHTLASASPFGAFMYGFDNADSYGYAGGLSLAPIARVTSVDLALRPPATTLEVGTETCAVATVTDQNDAPVVGVRVDFTVDGVHPASAFANSDEAGEAEFCYTGEVAGQDAIRAGVGAIEGTVTVTWSLACNPFVDVDLSNPFCFDIEWMADNDLANGWPDGTYRPGVDVSRQAKAAFIWRLNGSPAAEPGFPTFPDVLADNEFFDAIAWISQEGIAEGYEDGTYRPETNISRQAVAAFLWRLAGSPEPASDDPAFSDVPAGHQFFDAIAWLAEAGIAEGYPDGTFRPTEPTSRQAKAAFLRRFVDATSVS